MKAAKPTQFSKRAALVILLLSTPSISALTQLGQQGQRDVKGQAVSNDGFGEDNNEFVDMT